jgi:CheY-like chemotaxis protein
MPISSLELEELMRDREENLSQPREFLRVLYVEHDPDDVELGRRELERGGYQIRADVVATPQDFTERLRSQRYDLILADYRLPGWTGLEALDLLREEGLDVPFILMSGTLGEEILSRSVLLLRRDLPEERRAPSIASRRPYPRRRR